MADTADHSALVEARLRATLDRLIEGAQIIDRGWRYLYVNPAAARQGGRSVEELVGHTMPDVYPGIERTELFAASQRVMESGIAAEMENDFVLPDGTVKSFQLMIQPVPEGLFILSMEITERRRAEHALRESYARFEAVVENLHEGLIVADLDGNFLHWNRAALAMLGLSISDEGRRAVGDFARIFDVATLDGQPVAFEDRPMPRVLRGEQFSDLELCLTRVGTEWKRIFAYSGSIVRYGEGQSLAFVTIRDVTERKQLERQFVRAQRLESIGTLASGMAHDLNNILMPILLGATALRRLGLDERFAHTIESIERSAERGADLVRQVLSFARGTTRGHSALRVENIVVEVGAIVRSTFPKNVRLVLDLPGLLPPVSGDATQLLQVVLNLCVNARDAMPNGGTLRIAAASTWLGESLAFRNHVNPGHYVVIEVRDEGTGMAPAVLDRIFEPFFTTKEEGKGTGLGLFTAHQIVRSHAGFVDVASEEGSGTTFRIFLPVQVEEPLATQREEGGSEAARGNGELILVVDDEATILSVTKQTLEAFGYEVVTAEDGAEAAALFSEMQAQIALVVTDMMMPVVDGAALIAAFRQVSHDLPIIATSGSGDDDWLLRATSAGARDFLAKPYPADALLRMVAKLLKK
ncbi:MAG: PAS domain S-box protein [Acidobacteria bacterium]|nr:PAS domain S-box protein [Acidobacteriota bacterium]